MCESFKVTIVLGPIAHRIFQWSKEAKSKVWNNDALLGTPNDPSKYPTSPERTLVGQGVDLSGSVFDGLVLSPILFSTFLKYADPLVDTDANEQQSSFVKHSLRIRRLSDRCSSETTAGAANKSGEAA
jgi:hypothetical protein